MTLSPNIAARAAAIRAGWSEAERLERTGAVKQPAIVDDPEPVEGEIVKIIYKQADAEPVEDAAKAPTTSRNGFLVQVHVRDVADLADALERHAKRLRLVLERCGATGVEELSINSRLLKVGATASNLADGAAAAYARADWAQERKAMAWDLGQSAARGVTAARGFERE